MKSSCKRPQPLLGLPKWTFPLFLSSRKRLLSLIDINQHFNSLFNKYLSVVSEQRKTKKRREMGFLVLAMQKMEREPNNERGGEEGRKQHFLPFFPTPVPLFCSPYFSWGF